MPYSLNVEGHEKSQLVISLAALLLADAGLELTSDGLDAVVKASGNSIPAYYSKMYAAYLEKSGGVEKFCSGPSAGGAVAAGGAAAAAPAAAEAAAPVKPKEEEVDALEGGMDMFGGGGSDY